jgi:hypothetical protein
VATVRTAGGRLRKAEVRWYDAHYLRVIDDSGEDYLYPAGYFVEIELPDTVEEALRLAS